MFTILGGAFRTSFNLFANSFRAKSLFIMNSLLSVLGSKIGLIVLVVAIVGGGAFVLPKLTGDDLKSVVTKNVTESLEKSAIPYKDLDVEVVKNDGTRATVKYTLTKQGLCLGYVETDVAFEIAQMKWGDPLRTGTWKITDDKRGPYQELGVPSYTRAELAQLQAMGVLGDEKDKKVLKQWKRCMEADEYVKTGNKWVHADSVVFHPALLPPKEQEKLGYKVTEEDVQKFLPSPTPTPQPVQQNQQFSSDGLMIVDTELEGRKLKLLVANTDVEKMKGLRGRRELTEADGMAFNYFQQTVEITNEYTYLDLDVYWMQGNNIAGKDFLPSFEKNGKKTLKSPVPIDAVILVVKR
jgi:hypothetical protein